MNDNKLTKSIWFYLGKGVIIAVASLIINAFVSLMILATYATPEGLITDIPNYAVNIVRFVASLLVYNSVFGIFLSFDRTLCDEFLAHSTDNKDSFKTIFDYRSFIAECSSTVAILAVAGALGAASEIAGMFWLGEGMSPHSRGIVPCLVTAVITLLIFAFNRYEAVRYWRMLKKQGNLEEISSKSKVITRCLIVAVGYPLVLPYLPLFAFVAFTLLGAAAAIITVPALIIIFVLIIVALIGIKILLALHHRRKLIKNLKTLIRQHGFQISDIKNPYISLFKTTKQCNFTIKDKKKSYDCLMLGHIRRGIPICFTSESTGYYRYRLGTKRYNITLERRFEYQNPGDGIKIIIISPEPKYAYLCDPDSGKERRLFNADKLWEYVIYAPDGFLGALDRDCLGKHTAATAQTEDVKIPRLPFLRS